MSKDLNGYQNTLLGVTAAFIEGIILQPTVYWKNAQALKLPFSINPSVVYRGTAASIFNECQMMGLQFGFTGFYQNLLINKNNISKNSSSSSSSKNDNQVLEFISAFLGGVSSAFFASPVELVMIQQQLHGGSSIKTFMKIVNYNVLLRGLMPTIGRDAIYVTGMLGVTPYVQEYLINEKNISVNQAGFYASIIGGIIAAVPSHPFDIVKTCIQAKKLNNATIINSTVNNSTVVSTGTGTNIGVASLKIEKISAHKIGMSLYKEGGLRRLYAGAAWRTFNVTATVYIANECRVRMSPFFATL